jgi:hypothetical protein
VASTKRNKSYRLSKIHDRRSRDLPRNAEVVAVEVDDPLALEAGEKIVALRSIRNDPLGRLHSHHQLDEAQFLAGRAFQHDWERAERGPQAVDPGPRICRRRANPARRSPKASARPCLRLNRAERELGADGSALAHDVLVKAMTMDQVGQRRGLESQRWRDYFSRRLLECLDRLALVYGFANGTEDRHGPAHASCAFRSSLTRAVAVFRSMPSRTRSIDTASRMRPSFTSKWIGSTAAGRVFLVKTASSTASRMAS